MDVSATVPDVAVAEQAVAEACAQSTIFVNDNCATVIFTGMLYDYDYLEISQLDMAEYVFGKSTVI